VGKGALRAVPTGRTITVDLINVDLGVGEAYAHGTIEIDERLVEFFQAAIMEYGGRVRVNSERSIVIGQRPIHISFETRGVAALTVGPGLSA
jgi:hypothetical protein